MIVVDLRAVLSAFLVAAGTMGRREAEIRKRFNHIAWEEVEMHLQDLWDNQYVQRFTDEKKKRIWRATEKLNV